jgi:hypothetical protein
VKNNRTRVPKIFRWEDPPASRAPKVPEQPGGGAWQETVARLQMEPGRWAVIYEGTNGSASGLAWSIRRGGLVGWGYPGDFETTTRAVAGQTLVYARYVGGDE